jgi:RHS repeat-associated protein
MKNVSQVLIPHTDTVNIVYDTVTIEKLTGNGGREDLIYYYHGNHLSSTQTITDGWGYAVQQVVYAPFGEVVKERNQNWNNNVPAYLFNGKELDEESGMYYFEARYMKPPTFISRDPLFEKYAHFSPYVFTANNSLKYVDPDGNQPVKSQAGTIQGFVTFFNNTTTRMGTLKGKDAHNAMLRLGQTKFDFPRMITPATTAPFNTQADRYIYTEKGGWIDMSHFLFYAGTAYQYKQEGEKYPVGKALQDGLIQELSDMIFAKHSAFSYEDLPSDKFGAEFGANYFNPNSEKNFGEQLQDYMDNVLKATTPNQAPNYDTMPKEDSKNPPTRTNMYSSPIYTKETE